MIEGTKIYPTGNFIVSPTHPAHYYKDTKTLLVGRLKKNIYQSLIQFDIPEILEGAHIKTSLFLSLSCMSDHKKCSMMIYPLWNKLNHSAITYYDFFYHASDCVCFETKQEMINRQLKIDITDLILNFKERGSSFFGLLLKLRKPGIIGFAGIQSKIIDTRPYILIEDPKKDKIKVFHEKIIPSEKGILSKPLNMGFNANASFYIKNTSPIESITVQVQTSPDGQSFYNEGNPIQVPPCRKISLSSSVPSFAARLSVYGTLVFNPAEVTSIIQRH